MSGGTARTLGGLVDGEPLVAGDVVKVRTTGGGGWGDPLEREAELVRQDVIEGRVSQQAARDAYGVALAAGDDAGDWRVDEAATVAPPCHAHKTQRCRHHDRSRTRLS